MLSIAPRLCRTNAIVARLVLVGISLTTAAIASDSSDKSDVTQCLVLDQNPLDRGIEYKLTNHCKKNLSCSVAWTLSCGEKAPYQQYQRSVSASLTPEGDRTVTASASDCKGESWEIFRVSWVCNPQ